MRKDKVHLLLIAIYVSFFAVIGIAVYITQSALPLFALIFAPTVTKNDDEDE